MFGLTKVFLVLMLMPLIMVFLTGAVLGSFLGRR